MMKDKLEKTGHKTGYRRGKTLLLSFAALLVLGGLAAIPVGVTYQVVASEAAAEASVEETTEEPADTIETEAAF